MPPDGFETPRVKRELEEEAEEKEGAAGNEFPSGCYSCSQEFLKLLVGEFLYLILKSQKYDSKQKYSTDD